MEHSAELLCRYFHGKGRNTVLAGHRNTTIVKCDNPLDNRKTDAIALRSMGFVCLIKFIEDFFLAIG